MLSIISQFGTAAQYAYTDMLLAISTAHSETMEFVEYRDATCTAALITLDDPQVQFLVLRPPSAPAVVYKLTAQQEQAWQ